MFSKETMKANSAAATMPWRIIGSVTLQSARPGDAPRLAAASSIERSSPGEARGQQPHGPRNRDHDVRDERARRASRGAAARVASSISIWNT